MLAIHTEHFIVDTRVNVVQGTPVILSLPLHVPNTDVLSLTVHSGSPAFSQVVEAYVDPVECFRDFVVLGVGDISDVYEAMDQEIAA